jgi:hypothetical protein
MQGLAFWAGIAGLSFAFGLVFVLIYRALRGVILRRYSGRKLFLLCGLAYLLTLAVVGSGLALVVSYLAVGARVPVIAFILGMASLRFFDRRR